MIVNLSEVIRTATEHGRSHPQPEGREVADAYENGELGDHLACLHVIAELIRRLRAK